MKAQNKGGRPEFVATKEQRDIVQVMAGHNIHQDTIALALGITGPTLRKHFKTEISRAAAMVEATLASNQFNRAKANNAVGQRATEFILNTRFGWKKATETVNLELTGKDGGPVEVKSTPDEIAKGIESKLAGIASALSAGGISKEPKSE
jgi:hypothetical protein